jgi:hypothetical protein
MRTNIPRIEFYSGLEDNAAAALPAWLRLLATALGHVAVDPAHLTTLRRRTYVPPQWSLGEGRSA